MKKTLLLLLAATLVLSLAACRNGEAPTEEPTQPSAEGPTLPPEDTTAPTEPLVFDPVAAQPLFGSWELAVTVNSADMGIEGLDAKMVYSMIFTFTEEGQYIVSLDQEAADAAAARFREEMEAFLAETMYAAFEKQDLGKEAANEAMKAQYGKTVEEYARESAANVDPRAMFKIMASTGDYFVRDGQIFTPTGGGEYEVNNFTLQGDTLTFQDTSLSEKWETLNITFPVVMTRLAPKAG